MSYYDLTIEHCVINAKLRILGDFVIGKIILYINCTIINVCNKPVHANQIFPEQVHNRFAISLILNCQKRLLCYYIMFCGHSFLFYNK